MKFLSAAPLALSFAVFAGHAAAQSVDPESMIRAVGAESHGPLVTALRDQGALNMTADQRLPPSFDFASVDVGVAFDGDSPLLTTPGMKALRSVAVALKDPRLSNQSFQVAAHMAAKGGETQRISAKRAQAVVDHLVFFHGIAPSRLTAVGYGATAPRNAAQPASVENTRIAFVNVTGL